jgi:DNA repair photolyase
LRKQYEPGASSIQSRFDAVRFFYQQGIKTWVSVEPVIDCHSAIEVIRQLSLFVDLWKIGKLNHDKTKEDSINWTEYLWSALNAVHPDSSYYVKDGLWAFADERTKVKFAKER